jgi:hypothetical protein
VIENGVLGKTWKEAAVAWNFPGGSEAIKQLPSG